MPFIGNQPTSGRFIELDSLTASATDEYTLQLNSANFSPESVNNLLVSINGVIQGSSTMSLNGAVLTVGATLSSSDTIDFVRVFGNVGTVSTPTDGSVTANKIGTGAVTTDKLADNSVTSAKITGVSFGKVLQVIQANSAVSVATTSTSFVTSGVAINITPIATSSKVLLRANIGGFYMLTNDDLYATIYRGSTNLGVGNANTLFYVHNDGGQNRYGNGSMEILDSPNTTSQVTYTIYFRTGNNQQVELNRPETGLFFTAMEIGA